MCAGGEAGCGVTLPFRHIRGGEPRAAGVRADARVVPRPDLRRGDQRELRDPVVAWVDPDTERVSLLLSTIQSAASALATPLNFLAYSSSIFQVNPDWQWMSFPPDRHGIRSCQVAAGG